MMIQIREATETDAVEAIETLRRSISELCVADHQNNPKEIADWLGNKTVEAWPKWVAQAKAVVLVAERHNKIIGVGMTTLSGDILLNYVHPEARYCGVSTALLAELEARLRSQGVQVCRLQSTITAKSFYQSRGFQPDGSDALNLAKAL